MDGPRFVRLDPSPSPPQAQPAGLEPMKSRDFLLSATMAALTLAAIFLLGDGQGRGATEKEGNQGESSQGGGGRKIAVLHGIKAEGPCLRWR